MTSRADRLGGWAFTKGSGRGVKPSVPPSRHVRRGRPGNARLAVLLARSDGRRRAMAARPARSRAGMELWMSPRTRSARPGFDAPRDRGTRGLTRTGRTAGMDTRVGADTREELSRDPYAVYRRLRAEGACVWLAAADRYVVPRWEDVVGLDEVPGITAREEPSLMTRAMGRTMLRTDGDEHARLRAPAHAPLRFRGFASRWGDMLGNEAQDLLAPLRHRGRMEVLRDFAGPFAARTLRLLLGLHAARDVDLEFASQAFIDGVGNYADDGDAWQRCERANRLVDDAITADWDRAQEGTVLRALIDAGTLSEAEVRANIKLFI